MKITDIKINLVDSEKMKAFVDVELEEKVNLKGLILKEQKGDYVLMSKAEKGRNNKYYPFITFDPLFLKAMTEEVVLEYLSVIEDYKDIVK